MGTFRIKLNTVSLLTPAFSSVGADDAWSGEDSNHDPLTSSSQFPVALSNLVYPTDFNGTAVYKFDSSSSGTLRFDTDGTTIVLDGNEGSPIDFASLPAGFNPLTAHIRVIYSNECSPPSSYQLFIQQDVLTESSPFTINSSTPSSTESDFAYNFSPIPPTMLDIISNGCGLRLVKTLSNVSNGVEFLQLDIVGTYEIQAFNFKLNIPQPVTPGDTVSLTSSGPNALDFTKVTSLTVGGIDVDSSLWTFSEFFFSFPTPDYSTLGVLEIVITSTEFSGSMSLGKITTILFKGASGIYTLDLTATHDTLYDIVNGGTVAVKIPDPFIKTFFAGS